uniref:Uncharacterized protein n=1 Tax=Lotus japonicus TaxID=34305 RepID=I3SGN3_LOTJA|nr:unknown [Lotus japonicus]
MQIFRSAMGSS